MTRSRQNFADLPLPQQAGILSNDTQFQKFAGARCIKSGVQLSTTATAEFIRTFCNIKSRADLTTNADACAKFKHLRTDFDAWSGRIATPR